VSIVVAHAAVALAHGWAHRELGVGLDAFQRAFVTAVLGLAPLTALALLWAGFPRSGSWLLAAAMAGSLVFGVYHHYVLVSADHVSHLPAGAARGLFRVTALLLAAVAALGFALAALESPRSRLEP
jgi:hypothetical protein